LPVLTLYTRQGCHLCDQFLLELSLDLGPLADGLALVDVDSEESLAARYGLRVPVLETGGTAICEAVYDRGRVRAALRL
jgi:hypothetical protein